MYLWLSLLYKHDTYYNTRQLRMSGMESAEVYSQQETRKNLI